MPKEKAPCKCLSIIMLHSVLEAKKQNYPQVLLEKCKYEQKRRKMENLIDDYLKKVNLMVILMMKQNLILKMKNNLFKEYFNNNKA